MGVKVDSVPEQVVQAGTKPVAAACLYAITVSDLNKSIAFYQDMLGMRLMDRRRLSSEILSPLLGYPDMCPASYAFLALPESETLVKLTQFDDVKRFPPEPRVSRAISSHLEFRTRELDAIYERLMKAGCTIRSKGIQRIPTGMRAFYVEDPDGYLIEPYQPPY